VNPLLRNLPGVDELTRAAQQIISGLRTEILAGERSALPGMDELAAEAAALARRQAGFALRPVINATGIILHTNLGRAPLAPSVAEYVHAIAENYSTLEYNSDEGGRGSRNAAVEGLLCRLTGCEAAVVVNNNAAAVLLALSGLCQGKEAIVSRGEQVEIGGAFRVPDVIRQGGAVLREVGTTNKTRLTDYERAIQPGAAGGLLKVHTSNYKIVGFTEEVPLDELAALGKRHGIPVIYDIGSGLLVDGKPFGLAGEPTVPGAVVSGADVIAFSGDKLLGGPQCGILIGRRAAVEPLKKHPLTRALRLDKLSLAALEATLRLYLDPERAMREIPVLAMLSADSESLRRKAEMLHAMLSPVLGGCAEVASMEGQVGGGSVPGQALPSWGVAAGPGPVPVEAMERHLRGWRTPIIARIHKDRLLLDVRTVREDQFAVIADAFAGIAL
jgi:L-seryl-tRNA(Ser) seleniumtransferase